MMASLLLQQDGEQKTFPCQALTALGRDKNNDIVLTDLKVSRNHAILRCLGEQDYYLIDSGSANGSYVNAKRVSLPTLLQNGDTITVGSSHFTFTQEKTVDVAAAEDDGAQTVIIQPKVEVGEMAILVADIRGFTALSEAIAIETLTKIMNTWFHAVTDCIQQQQGLVDKFLGDCVYARWQGGSTMSDAVTKVLKATILLNEVCDDINDQYHDVLQGGRELRIGVGINTGIAAVGVDQSDTAIGDAVNLAFRLESESKKMKKDVVIGQDAYQFLPEHIWADKVTTIAVRGRTDSVDACGLMFSELADYIKSL